MLASGVRVEALAWRRGEAILVTRATLEALGVHSAARTEPVSLRDIPGLTFTFDADEQAVLIACASTCFAMQSIEPARTAALPVTRGEGGFLNLDAVATRHAGSVDLAGAFELGIFSRHGFGGASWIAGTAGENARFVRLDTSWTLDFPDARTRLSIGDAIASGGVGGAPFRFAGVQFGTDFSLDPTFVPFPTPTFAGDAAAASVVDFYVDGALRARERVDPGPFEIIDAPIVAGGGLARVVVTDVLGRQSVVETPFYASPNLLRPGLSDYAFAIGAERERYGAESTHYGRGFALASIRHGLTRWATLAGRAELSGAFAGAAGGVSLGAPSLGQFDLAVAAGGGPRLDGAFASLSWSARGERVAFAAHIEAADADFRRLGQEGALPRQRARATIGVNTGASGRFSTTAVWQDDRDARVRTFEVGYANTFGRFGALSVSALHVDDGESSTELRLTLSRPFGERRSGALSLQTRGRRFTTSAQLQSAPPGVHGLAWRAALSEGAVDRFDGGISIRARQFDAQVEINAGPETSAQRAQFSAGVAVLDGEFHVAPSLRESFATVRLGAADVDIFRDGQWVARTDERGRAFVTGLRAYEPNRITFKVDDLAPHLSVQSDELVVRPAARSGATLRFPVTASAAGEVRVANAAGEPLPEGAILVRRADGARFAIGSQGRVYLDAIVVPGVLVTEAAPRCAVEIDAAALGATAPLTCRAL